MARTPNNTGGEERAKYSDTDRLLPGRDLALLKVLDEYRRIFEKEWGPTDTTKIYSTMLSLEMQHWLADNEPERYYKEWPKFYQAFIRDRVECSAQDGRLDDMPDFLVELFLQKKLKILGEAPRR